MSIAMGDPRLPPRFWAKVELGPEPENRSDLDSCWIWTGANRGNGYGAFKLRTDDGARVVSAHRHAYLTLVGATALALDHLCRTRNCVNVAHLEPVTVPENNLRSPIVVTTINVSKTHCPRQHPYDETNTRYSHNGTRRNCRACQREKRAEARIARAAA